MSSPLSQMSSSSYHRSVEVDDSPSSTNDNKISNFPPLYRTNEIENIHSHVNQDQQSTPLTTSSTKKVLTKCFTVIGDGTDK